MTGRHLRRSLGVGSDVAIVAGVQADDPECLGVLYDRHAAAVFGLCLSRTSSRRQAEEALLDTFVEAWNSRHRIRLFDGTARVWLLAVAYDVADRLGRPAATRQHR